MKKLLCVVAAGILMIVGGCSCSSEHKTETAVGVNSNGKVETKVTSSVYTERTENGKTVNSKASVAVGSQGVNNEISGLSYIAEDADLRKGEAEIDGYFYNNGSNTVKINAVTLSFTFKDNNGKVIWEDTGKLDNLDLVVRPGEDVTYDFIVKNPNAPLYTGPFDMKYTINMR
ncbi:MAG: hypothetical protein J6O04_10945 [Selenomonadaceae bacterium]|nr:hypothetical protein [Selenomonadaceae bacterium]